MINYREARINPTTWLFLSLTWNLDLINNLFYDVIGGYTFHFFIGSKRHSVPEGRKGDSFDVLGCYKIATIDAGVRFGSI